MVIMKKLLIIFAAAAMLLVTSCGSKKPVPSTIAYTSHATECLGQDAVGAQRLRVWGQGKDFKAAQEDARKKAVEEVTFNHVTAGAGNCNSWPVIDNPTARRTHHEYFAKFFKDGGKYKKYIKAEKPSKSDAVYGNDCVVVEMEITVDREGLQKRFTKDHILE